MQFLNLLNRDVQKDVYRKVSRYLKILMMQDEEAAAADDDDDNNKQRFDTMETVV